jgi:hypothetical protein
MRVSRGRPLIAPLVVIGAGGVLDNVHALFREISNLTERGKLRWKKTNKFAHPDLVFNDKVAFNQFTVNMKKGGKEYKLLLLEKRGGPNAGFDHERFRTELLVIHNHKLLATITESMIDRASFKILMKTAESGVSIFKRLLSI